MGTIDGETPTSEDVTVHADTEIPVESVEISLPEVHVYTKEHVIVVPEHKSESSSSSSPDSDDDGVLPTEDVEKKKKVKKIKVKKEKKPKEKQEKRKKDKSFKIPDIDGGLTIDGEGPVVDDVVVHADTDIPTESVAISLPEVDVHTEEHVIVVPEPKSDSSSSSSSDFDDDGVLPTEVGEKKKKVKKIKVKKEKKPKEKKEKKPKEKSFKIPDIDGGLTIDGEGP